MAKRRNPDTTRTVREKAATPKCITKVWSVTMRNPESTSEVVVIHRTPVSLAYALARATEQGWIITRVVETEA